MKSAASGVISKQGAKESFLPPIASAQKPVQIKTKEDVFMARLNMLCSSRQPEVVYLNIYNVTNINGCLEVFGFGLYHTSVGIYDLEVSYGGHDEDSSGIVVVDKGNNAGLELKESLAVGITYYSADEIDEIIDNFGEFWHGRDYDPFSKNCNTFTEHMIKSICEKEQFYVPSYVNRFTKLGSVLRMWFKPLQELVGDIVNYGDSESASSDEQYMPRIKVQQNRSISSQEDPDRSA